MSDVTWSSQPEPPGSGPDYALTLAADDWSLGVGRCRRR
jgi:hypothetical protein